MILSIHKGKIYSIILYLNFHYNFESRFHKINTPISENDF
jgi:hypothetical protein